MSANGQKADTQISIVSPDSFTPHLSLIDLEPVTLDPLSERARAP